jgi:hypothetical protein
LDFHGGQIRFTVTVEIRDRKIRIQGGRRSVRVRRRVACGFSSDRQAEQAAQSQQRQANDADAESIFTKS